MTEIIQLCVELTIVQGKLNDVKELLPVFLSTVQKDEPGMLAYQVYFNSTETKCYIVEWLKNSDAVVAHFNDVGGMMPKLVALAPITRAEVFGNLSAEAEEKVKSIGANVYGYFAGFVR